MAAAVAVPSAVEEVMQAFRGHPPRVDLSGVDLAHPPRLNALLFEMRTNTTCSELSLDRCSLGAGVGRLVTSLLQNPAPRLQSLSLQGNDLGPRQQGVHLARLVTAHETLRQLDLTANRLGADPPGLTALFNALVQKPNGPLMLLNLSDNGIEHIDAEAFEAVVHAQPNLFINAHGNNGARNPTLHRALRALNDRLPAVGSRIKQLQQQEQAFSPAAGPNPWSPTPPVAQNTPVGVRRNTHEPPPTDATGPTSPVTGKPCAQCTKPVVDFEYRCCTCPRYRLCVPCYNAHQRTPIHPADHLFVGNEVVVPPPAPTVTVAQGPTPSAAPTEAAAHTPLKAVADPRPPGPKTEAEATVVAPLPQKDGGKEGDDDDEEEGLIPSPRAAATKRALFYSPEKERSQPLSTADGTPTRPDQSPGVVVERSQRAGGERDDRPAAPVATVPTAPPAAADEICAADAAKGAAIPRVTTPSSVPTASPALRPLEDPRVRSSSAPVTATALSPKPKSYHHGMQLKSELASQILKQLHDMGISSSSESDEEPTSGRKLTNGARPSGTGPGSRGSSPRLTPRREPSHTLPGLPAGPHSRSPKPRTPKSAAATPSPRRRPKPRDESPAPDYPPDRDERVLVRPTAAAAPRIPISYLAVPSTDIAAVVAERCKRAARAKVKRPPTPHEANTKPRDPQSRLGPGTYTKDLTTVPFVRPKPGTRNRSPGFNTRGRPIWGM